MKKDISNWNFTKYNDELTTDMLYEFAANSSWLLPQLMSFIGTKWPLRKNDEGQISFRESLLALGSDCKEEKILFSNAQPLSAKAANGILRLLTVHPRGGLLPKTLSQSSGDGLRWSAAVPLVLSAFKQYRNVPYNMWSWDEDAKKYFLDKDNLDASGYFFNEFNWTSEDYLDFRIEGSTIKTGDKAGNVKAPQKVTALSGVSDQNFKSLPRLIKLMLTQCWVYHPALRNEYMICDPTNLDNLPEPLVDSDIFVPAPKEARSEFPWDIL